MKKIILTKKLAILYKISIVLGLVSLPLYIVVVIALGIFSSANFTEDTAYVLFCIVFSIFIIFGIVVLIFPFVVEDPNCIMSVKTKAEKHTANVSSFENFLNDVEKAVLNENYSRIDEQSFESFKFYLYAKPLKRSNLDLVLIIKFNEFNDDIVNLSNDVYTECLKNNYSKKFRNISSHISVTTFCCVDKINSYFKRFMNDNLEQDFDFGRFIVGLSFGGKGLYIMQQKAGLGITKYKKYRKRFFDMFGFLINNNL